jgi:hypothetical protein
VVATPVITAAEAATLVLRNERLFMMLFVLVGGLSH